MTPSGSRGRFERYLVFWIAVLFLVLGSFALWGEHGLGVATFGIGVLFGLEWVARSYNASRENQK